MKRIYLLIMIMVSSMTTIWADNLPSGPEQASSTCEWLQKLTGLPSHFCVCQEDSKKFSFPLDMKLNGTVWYNATLGDVKQGITAYLYADCEVKIEIFLTCALPSAAYSYTLSPNQTRDINADAIEKKLESAGVEGIDDKTTVYLKIYPVGGTVERVICMPYNQGYHSTCSDCLAIFPEMTIVSSHEDDVFYLDPSYIPADKGLAVSWKESNAMPCGVKITRAKCDGEVLAEAEIVSKSQPYHIDIDLLKRAREAGERLYLHFSHDASAVGRIRLEEYEKTPTALVDINAETPARMILDNGVIYIQRDNQRYTILGNKL